MKTRKIKPVEEDQCKGDIYRSQTAYKPFGLGNMLDNKMEAGRKPEREKSKEALATGANTVDILPPKAKDNGYSFYIKAALFCTVAEERPCKAANVVMANYDNIDKKREAFLYKWLTDREEEVFDGLTDLNLKHCVWYDLVHAGLLPITASRFMLLTRGHDCENVALTQEVIRWAKGFLFKFDYTTSVEAEKLLKLKVAPADVRKYRKLEWIVRRLQRVEFPYATALEAERLIMMLKGK